MRSPLTDGFALPWALVAGITSLAGPAVASRACPLVVRLGRPDPSWEAAAARARDRLQNDDGDCERAELSVDEHDAVLTFTTSDGRRAVRTLHDPAELEPVLAALLVELPRFEAGTTSNLPMPVEPPPAPPAPPTHLSLSGVAGARIAGPGALLTPVIGAAATVSLSGWDLGVAGTWCPSYVSLIDDVTRPGRLTSLAAGVAVGRRLRVGKSVALLGGGSLAAAFEHESWRVDDQNGGSISRETERGQMLVGAYAGAAFPTRWKTHFLSTLSADFDATHVGQTATTVEGAPELPWWGVTLAVGVESEVL